MASFKRFRQRLQIMIRNQTFVTFLDTVQVGIAKILSLAMVCVILGAVVNLSVFLINEIVQVPYGRFAVDLIEIFGLFLNVLIALEILENISAYMRDHSIQVELVVATSLIAVARKIIVLDFDNTSGIKIIGLALAIFALSISYWLMRMVKRPTLPPRS